MRKIAYFLIGCTLVGLIISTVFSTFPVFTVIGRGFLLSLSNGQYEQAYSMTSADFQKRNSLYDFKNRVQAVGLDQFDTVVWGEQIVDKEKKGALISGQILTKSQKTLDIQIEMIQVQGASIMDKGWRIDGLYVREAKTPMQLPPAMNPSTPPTGVMPSNPPPTDNPPTTYPPPSKPK